MDKQNISFSVAADQQQIIFHPLLLDRQSNFISSSVSIGSTDALHFFLTIIAATKTLFPSKYIWPATCFPSPRVSLQHDPPLIGD